MLKKALIPIISLAVVASVIFAGCANPAPTPAPAPAPSPAPTPGPTPAPEPELTGTITEAGSTTVQPLAELLAAEFMTMHPKVTITIQGGGTSVGITSVDDGTVDIGAASRELKPEEPQCSKHLLARDGIAIVVNSADSAVTNLTKIQVREIFAGEITNWQDVGGPDEDIIVVAREEGSGTRGAFQELVMGKDADGKDILITNEAILQSSNGAVRTTIATTPYSIGFISFGYLDASVKALDIEGVAATVANVLSADYPISRPLYFLTKTDPTGIVKAFIDYCLSTEAQPIVVDEGYISVE